MKKIFMLAILFACSLWSIPCSAQSVATSDGTAWLSANQNADGSWGVQSDLAIVYSADVLGALKYFDPNGINFSQGISWLNSQDAASTDELSRKIFALVSAGQDVSTLISTLVGNKYSDGGWGLKAGDISNPLDTALALQALKAANYSDSTIIYQAINFLTTNQNTDGGWGYRPTTTAEAGDSSNAYVTSMVLRALSSYRSQFIVQGSIDTAKAYLLTKQNEGGGFGSSPSTITIYETALSIISLIESGQGGALPLQNAIAYLAASQSANGSWNDDPYSTALALRVLAKVRPNLTVAKADITFSKTMPQAKVR
jgi:large repetitive protein